MKLELFLATEVTAETIFLYLTLKMADVDAVGEGLAVAAIENADFGDFSTLWTFFDISKIFLSRDGDCPRI